MIVLYLNTLSPILEGDLRYKPQNGFKCIWPDALSVDRPTGVYLLDFFCSGIQFNFLLSFYLCFVSFLYIDLYVRRDDPLIS